MSFNINGCMLILVLTVAYEKQAVYGKSLLPYRKHVSFLPHQLPASAYFSYSNEVLWVAILDISKRKSYLSEMRQ